MKKVKSCQECGLEFRSKGGFSRHKKVTDCHCQTWKLHSICCQAKLKKIVKKAAKKIVDDKLQSEDVLQEL